MWGRGNGVLTWYMCVCFLRTPPKKTPKSKFPRSMSEEQKHKSPSPSSAWKRFAPDAKTYETSQCITHIMYVNKYMLHSLFRMIPYEPDWDILNQDGSRPCLFNYLDYTFRRAVDQGYVWESASATGTPTAPTHLVFSVGLENNMGEAIYCLVGPNKPINNSHHSHRIFSIIGFVTEFLLTGDWMQQFHVEPLPMGDMPPKPTYPLPRFNPKLPLPEARIHATHLLRDGHLDKLKLLVPKHLRATCEEAHKTRGKGWQEFLVELHTTLRRAIMTSLNLARKDPDLVALHFCRSRNEIQFLLPVNLSEPDLCLKVPEQVITLRLVRLRGQNGMPTEMYEVTTLLPVHTARNNARLLGVPPQEWLWV